MQEWILTKEKLPKHNELVVGWFGSSPKILIWNKTQNIFFDFEKEFAYQPYNIKYWCSIPSARGLNI